MPGYFSEVRFYGDASQEFIEIALPTGTDPSGYLVYIYSSDGTVAASFPLGPSTGTMDGHDVYVIDASTPGFDDGGADSTGRMHPGDGLALVDGSNNVDQFLSYLGNTVTATEGPANGTTSTNAGNAGPGESIQSDDGGSSYYTQSEPNSGSIPACYAPGTLIATSNGPVRIENLSVGDLVTTMDRGLRPVRWIWSGYAALDQVDPDQKPVLIRKGALGIDRPSQDLIVSAQHRIVVGIFGQLDGLFVQPAMVPAKALTDLPGIRFMAGKQSIHWYHILCDDHALVNANGLTSETMLLGPIIVRSLSRQNLVVLSRTLQRRITPNTDDKPALPCLKVGEARSMLKRKVPLRVTPPPQLRAGASTFLDSTV